VAKEPTLLFGVGATKSGTSWLYDYLASHPECHLRGIKELHYFDTVEKSFYHQQLTLHDKEAARLREKLWGAKGKRQMRVAIKLRDVLDWHGVLAERTENTTSYLSYLSAGLAGQSLIADITPSYALLPEARLKTMAGLQPETRFIYLMRDPIARLWSHVRMNARRAGHKAAELAAACQAVMERVLDGKESGVTQRGDYIAAIKRLNEAVDPSKLLVMFMEEMLTPAGLARICGFLGLTYHEAKFDQPVHAGPVLAMSPSQKTRAGVLLRPQYEFIARHYPDIPANWRKNMGEGTL
jgi:hypothetical protein